MSIFVQFSDDTKTEIIAVFGCEQDPIEYPNQGEIEANDARYASWYNALPAQSRSLMPQPA